MKSRGIRIEGALAFYKCIIETGKTRIRNFLWPALNCILFLVLDGRRQLPSCCSPPTSDCIQAWTLLFLCHHGKCNTASISFCTYIRTIECVCTKWMRRRNEPLLWLLQSHLSDFPHTSLAHLQNQQLLLVLNWWPPPRHTHAPVFLIFTLFFLSNDA
jgi:hypothetical protein